MIQIIAPWHQSIKADHMTTKKTNQKDLIDATGLVTLVTLNWADEFEKQ